MTERILQAEAALAMAIRQKLTPLQRLVVRDCPELLRRLAHTSAQEPRRFEVAEDVAYAAVPRVARRLEELAGPGRAAVASFFEQCTAALHPLCLEVALAIQGKATDLNRVVENVLCLLSELPPDKKGVIWRFGTHSFVSDIGDSADKILKLLVTPWKTRRRRSPHRTEPASRLEIEALAQRWDEYREPPPRPCRSIDFDGQEGLDLSKVQAVVLHVDLPWDKRGN